MQSRNYTTKLLADANSTIADWRTELALEISDDDKDSLTKWMAYIRALKTLDLSGVKDCPIAFTAIRWPFITTVVILAIDIPAHHF